MKSLFFSLLSSDEVQTFSSRINEIILAGIINDSFISKTQPFLAPSIVNLSLAHGRTTDSTHVQILKAKDLVRDTRFIALRDYSKAFLTDDDPNLVQAATTIVNIIKELGWTMYSKGLAAESASLQALFDRFDKAPASAAITTLGATAKYTGLKAAQADFEDTYKNKVDAKAKEEYPFIHDCRKSIIRYLGGILVYIDLMAEVEGGAYKTTASKINEVITEAETIARTRQTKNKNEKANSKSGTAK